MAHFAQLNENNVVTQVIVVNDNDCLLGGVENETVGAMFCKLLFGADTRWKQTSYNAKIRKNYAGVGYTYHADIDAFIPPQPYPSWTLDTNAQWQPPIAMPTDDKAYFWDETAISWIVTTPIIVGT
jgi:hypothetical protein